MEEISFISNNYEKLNATTRILLLLLGVVVVHTLIRRLWSRKRLPPGPIGIPILGYVPFLGKEPHKTLWNMKSKYGDIIGIYLGPRYTVILNEYSVAKEVLSNPSALDRAPNLFDHIPEIGFETKNGEEWVEQRRFCFSAARDLGIGKGQWEELIAIEIADFLKELKATNGDPVDFTHLLGTSIASNIMSLLIGRQLEKNQEEDKIQTSLDVSDAAFRSMGATKITTLLPPLRKVFEFFKIDGFDKAAIILERFHRIIQEEIDRHRTSPLVRSEKDFINLYLNKMEEVSKSKVKHYFSDEMLRGNLKIIFLGASDTTFSSLIWLLRLMATHADVQQKVYEELREALGKEGQARYNERQNIPYTFAVLMEAQRYSSILYFNTPRRATQNIEINGYTIPKGAEIAANLWALHNDPAYWKQPELFLPERFLSEDGAKLITNPPSYAPFSIGRRDCPGQTVAWMEILGYFSEIIKHFEVSLEPGVASHFESIDGLVNMLKPQPLCFKWRES